MSEREPVEDLPARLRTLRLHLALTEREIGARVGVSARSWRRRETMLMKPGQRGWMVLLLRLSEEFGVSIDWMLRGAASGMPRNDQRPMRPDGTPLFPVH